MAQMTSLKQYLKTEVHSRKEMEEQFMTKINLETNKIENLHKINYMNKMYLMKETLVEFSNRQLELENKLNVLNGRVDKKLSKNKIEL